MLVTVRYSPGVAGTDNQSVSFTGGGGASRPVSGSAYNSNWTATGSAAGDLDTRDYTLAVASARGTPVPAVGTNTYAWHSTVACSVDSVVSAGGTNYTCTGWTGTGAIPATGATNNTGVIMLTSASSSIIWNWVPSSYTVTGSAAADLDTRDYTLAVASARGTPVPAVGTNSYAWHSTVTCSVDSIVSAGGTNYSCTGWTGTGAIPATGTTNNTGVIMLASASSSIIWNWVPSSYTVTFDAQSGTTPNPVSKQVTSASTYGALASTTRAGYAFEGWFTAPTGGTQVTDVTTVTATADHTLYAHWTANPPVAGFTGSPTNGAAPLTVLFSNLSSGATSYSWDFGGGQTSTVINPANTYTNAGSYTVRLTAIGAGGTNRLTRTNYIVVTPPVSLTFSPAVWLPNVGMRLTLLGNATGSVSIRWTEDGATTLSNWPTLIRFTNFIGSTQYIDSAATNFGRRFYRAVSP